jgi:Domain of unknown function (DUF4347)/Putative Ig domain/Bacterial Ig domain
MTRTTARQFVFIDANVANASTLLAGIDPSFQVVQLNAQIPALAQIASVLQGQSGVDAIHLISHGSAGVLNLSSGALTTASLAEPANASALQTIQAALSEQADLLIYGCDVAAGDAGQTFVSALAQATGADVAASTNATGATVLGGDWVLEAATGPLETGVAVDASAQAQWLQTLGFPLNVGGGSSGLDSAGNVIIFNTNNGGGGDAITKIDAKGVQQWSKTFTITGSTNAFNAISNGAIATDSAGNIYITGSVNTGTTLNVGGQTYSIPMPAGFGGSALPNNVLIKLDANGNALWFKHAASYNSDSQSFVDVDTSGNVYWSGGMAAGDNFANTLLGSSYTSANQSYFLAKLDTNGNKVWANVWDAASGTIAYSQGLSVTPGGVASVLYKDSVTAYLRTYDASGSATLTATLLGTGSTIYGLEADSSGNLFVGLGKTGGGTFAGQAIGTYSVVKISSTGVGQWARDYSATNAPRLAMDDSGNVYVGIDGSTTITAGGQSYSGATSFSVVEKLNNSGTWQWGYGFNNLGVSTMEFGSTGQVLFSGYFYGPSSDFDPGPGTATLTAGFSRYTALLAPSGAIFVPGPTASSITPAATLTNGSSLNYTVTFSAAVTGVDAADFTLTNTGSGAGTIGTPTTANGGLTWTVPITGITGDGTVRLDLLNNGTILDASNGPLAAAKTGTAATVDHTGPSISGVTLPNSALRVGQTYTVTITAPDDGNGNYTLAPGSHVNGFTLGSLTKTAANAYTATFTVTEGGGNGDVAAGSDIPLSIGLLDAAGNTMTAYTTAIAQGSDRLDTHSPSDISPTFATLVTLQPNGTSVGTLATTDATVGGMGDSFTYSLVADSGTPANSADNGYFTIGGAGGNELIATTPGSIPSGTRHINVKVTDAAGNSFTKALTVTVINNTPPTLTAFADVVATATEDTQQAVTFANLTAQGDEADADTSISDVVSAFIVKAVSTGTLKIGTDANSATAWHATTNNIIDATHIAYWTPAVNANGTALNAFTVVARDNNAGESATPVQVKLDVTAINDTPTSVGGTASSSEDSNVTFTAAAFNYADVDASNSTNNFTLTDIKITSLPSNGVLKLSGADVALNAVIPVASIANLTFVPTANYNGAASFTYQVSDGLLWSADATMALTVNAVNDAPELSGTGNDLNTITEEDVANLGQTVASIMATLTDADSSIGSAVHGASNGLNAGVAVYATANNGPASGGTWQYKLASGGGWVDFANAGAVSSTSALLLGSTDSVRFVPDQLNGTTATFSYYLWDGASGSIAGRADVSVRGDATAFSTASDVATITVTSVNDAPVLDLDANNSSTATGDSTTAGVASYKGNFLIRGTGVQVLDTDMRITDVDNSGTTGATTPDTVASATVAITAGAIDNNFGTINETLVASGGNGTAGGFTVSGSGTPSISITGTGTWAQYETLLKTITYQNANPNAFHGVRTVSVTVNDSAAPGGTAGSAVATASIDNIWAPVVDTNGTTAGTALTATYTEGDAPVAIATFDSTITDEDSHLSQVVVSISNVQNVGLETLTVTGGNGANWSGITGLTVAGSGTSTVTISGNIAPSFYQLALRSIKYANASGSPSEVQRDITVVATDIDSHVGNTGHSYINVVSVPNAPTVANAIGAQTSTGAGTQTFQFAANTFTDNDGDALTYTATQADGTALPTWLTFTSAIRTFSGNPPHGQAPLSVKVWAWDGTSNAGVPRSGSSAFTWTFNTPNDTPTLANALVDQTHTGAGNITPYTFAANSFADADPGETLSYSAGLWDGHSLSALPAWLAFDATTRTFSGNPPLGTTSPLTVRVTATDSAGVAVTDDFTLTLSGNLNDIGGLPNPAQAAITDVPTQLNDFTVTDEVNSTQTFTVTLTPTNGSIGGLTDLDANTPGIQLSGTAAQLNAAIAAATFTATTAGAANIAIGVTDAIHITTNATYGLIASNPAPAPEPAPAPAPVPAPSPTPAPATPDNDGVAAPTEDSTPGLTTTGGQPGLAGDGNGDGTKDSEQGSVTSTPFLLTPTAETNPTGASPTPITLVADSLGGKTDPDAGNSNITSIVQKDAPAVFPAGMSAPLGLIGFTASLDTVGTSETFSLYLDPKLDVNGYWKQDASGTWVNLASAAYGGGMVEEGGKLRLDFQIVDGGQFDSDGVANGSISDPGIVGAMAQSITEFQPKLPVVDYFWF